MTTKKVAVAPDTSRGVWIEIKGLDGEVFARTPMSYMSALVFKATWEMSHIDSDRTISIVDK